MIIPSPSDSVISTDIGSLPIIRLAAIFDKYGFWALKITVAYVM